VVSSALRLSLLDVPVTWDNLWTIEGLVAAGTIFLGLATAALALVATKQVKIAATTSSLFTARSSRRSYLRPEPG